jgi:predicted membrane protein
VELDFSQAKLEGNQATIEVTAMFGGIDVFVPRDWKVVVDASAILGGVDNKHRQAEESVIKATLFVKATALFGGIDIKN